MQVSPSLVHITNQKWFCIFCIHVPSLPLIYFKHRLVQQLAVRPGIVTGRKEVLSQKEKEKKKKKEGIFLNYFKEQPIIHILLPNTDSKEFSSELRLMFSLILQNNYFQLCPDNLQLINFFLYSYVHNSQTIVLPAPTFVTRCFPHFAVVLYLLFRTNPGCSWNCAYRNSCCNVFMWSVITGML